MGDFVSKVYPLAIARGTECYENTAAIFEKLRPLLKNLKNYEYNPQSPRPRPRLIDTTDGFEFVTKRKCPPSSPSATSSSRPLLFSFRILFCSDGKFLLCVLGLKGANSKYPCPWCIIPSDEFLEVLRGKITVCSLLTSQFIYYLLIVLF